MSPISLFVSSWQNTARIEKIKIGLFFGQNSYQQMVYVIRLAKKKLSHILKFSERERPIVAQVFGANPENMKHACQYIASLGFDGIDINMGCPDKSVISQGAGVRFDKNSTTCQKNNPSGS